MKRPLQNEVSSLSFVSTLIKGKKDLIIGVGRWSTWATCRIGAATLRLIATHTHSLHTTPEISVVAFVQPLYSALHGEAKMRAILIYLHQGLGLCQ